MNKNLKIALLLGFFCSSVALAKDYPVSFSICKVNSSCSECIEKVSAEISIDESNRTASITGKSPNGAPVSDKLPNCNIESALNWKCEGLRGVIAAENGVVKYTPSDLPPLVVPEGC